MSGKWGRCLLTVAALICVAGSSFGFDGNRKGFVLGAGLGYVPTATATNADLGVDLSTNEALAMSGLIGYAWNNHNLIVAEFSAAIHDPEDWYCCVENQEIIQGFQGFAWYHYFGSKGRSLFSAVGIGLYVFGAELNGENRAGSGAGYLLGGGYEFTKQLQIGAYLVGGQSDSNSDTNGHTQLSILLTVIAY